MPTIPDIDDATRSEIARLEAEAKAKLTQANDLAGATGDFAKEHRQALLNRLEVLKKKIAVAKGRKAAWAALEKAERQTSQLRDAEANLIAAEGAAHAALHRATTTTGRAKAQAEIERIERLREDWARALDASLEAEQAAIAAYHGEDRGPALPRTVADLVRGTHGIPVTLGKAEGGR